VPNTAGSPSLLSTSERPGLVKATTENPAADLTAGGAFSTPGALPNVLPSGFLRPGASAPDVGGMVGSMLSGGSPGQVQNVLPMLRKG